MRVLLIAQYFPPETGAPPNRMISLVEGLLTAGHSVDIVTAKPNHPEGVIWEGYRKGFVQERRWNGCRVLYTWVWTSRKRGVGGRIFNYLSFMVTAFIAALGLGERPDIVVASSPPPFVGVTAWALARLNRVPYLLDLRDLWPGLAIALGELRNPLAIWLGQNLERFLYRSADGITTVTAPFIAEIRKISGEETPIRLSMNGTTLEFTKHDETRDALRLQRAWADRFVALYAGNVGVCQGLEHIIKAALLTPEVHFCFLGGGPRKEELMELAARAGTSNIEFIPRLPQDEAAAWMAAADALLVPLASHPMCDIFIPSKLFDSLATGRPVLLSVNGEARRILEASGGGYYYPAEDAQALSAALVALSTQPEMARAKGQRGRAYAIAHCLRSHQICPMVELAEHLTGHSKSSRGSREKAATT